MDKNQSNYDENNKNSLLNLINLKVWNLLLAKINVRRVVLVIKKSSSTKDSDKVSQGIETIYEVSYFHVKWIICPESHQTVLQLFSSEMNDLSRITSNNFTTASVLNNVTYRYRQRITRNSFSYMGPYKMGLETTFFTFLSVLFFVFKFW